MDMVFSVLPGSLKYVLFYYQFIIHYIIFVVTQLQVYHWSVGSKKINVIHDLNFIYK